MRPGAPAGTFSLRRWTTEDGLPRNTVISLLQTHDGYLWVGTRHGLARFDGVRFKVFTEELAIEKGGDLSCYDLMEDTVGRLWLRLSAGLVCYDHGRFQKFSIQSGPLLGTIQTAIASRDGGLWIGTQAGGLKRFENGRYTREYRTTNGLTDNRIGMLRDDREGRLWILSGPSEKSWQRLDPRSGEFKTLADVVGERIANVVNLHSDEAGRLWLATRDELLCWDQGKLGRFASGGVWGRNGSGIGQMISAGRDTLWSAPPFTGRLVRFQHGHFETFGVEDGLADTDFRSLLWDREGNLWVGMGVGGLQRIRPRSLMSLLTTNEVGDRQQIESVSAGQGGAVWLGAWSALLHWEDGALRRFTNSVPWEAVARQARFDLNAHPVFEDRTGQLWFGARDRGLFTLASNQVAHVLAADNGCTNWTVRVLHEDHAGRLWVGSDVGLLGKQGEHFVRYTTRDGLLDNDILGIRDALDGSLWVGTAKGLHCFRDGRFRPLTVRDGLLSDQANPLLVEDDGTVWVGTPLGLNRIRGGEIRAVTERQGLQDNALFCLLDDGAGYYWASSVRGIFRMRKTDLHAVADGRENRVYCVSYGEADGAASAEGAGGYQPSACRTPDGRMWFPTTRGAVVLDPVALVEKEIPPLVVIEEILADDQLVFADGGTTALGAQMRQTISGMQLPAGRAGVVEVRYTANSFVAPGKVQFRYRLEGADAQWRAAGTRRVAFYTNLRPRAYRFRVEASNREGTWSEQPAVFAFSIAPHFYETWPFYLLCGAGVIGLAAGVQAYRLRWQRRLLKLEEQRALANERARIARDLHDDLGANLTGIALQVDVAQHQLSHQQASLEGQLNTIAQGTRALVDQMREAIWAVNPHCDTLESFSAFLCQYAENFLGAAGIKCRLDFPVPMPVFPLTADTRHHLFLVVKEALNNAVKHAVCTEVWLRLVVENDLLRLVVKDNGHGFAARQAAPTESKGLPQAGHGMENMRQRVAELGGQLQVNSRLGLGTELTMEVPLKRS
ncbi:MAG: sensor histidine kinase [Limisphaerales bacterium]